MAKKTGLAKKTPRDLLKDLNDLLKDIYLEKMFFVCS